MKKILLLLITISISTFLYAQEKYTIKEIEDLTYRYKYDELKKAYEENKNSENNILLAVITYGLSTTADGVFEYGPRGREHAEEAINYAKAALREKHTDEEINKLYLIMAKMSNRMIKGPASWMKYGKIKDKYQELLLKADPGNIDAKCLEASDLLYIPESMGGNKEKGLQLLIDLAEKNPSSIEPLNYLAFYYMGKDKIKESEEYFRKIIAINPENASAQKHLYRIELMKSEPIIRNIIIKDGTKLNKTRLEAKVKNYENETFNFSNQMKIVKSLREIKAVRGAAIVPVKIDEKTVDLKVDVFENNTMMLGALGYFQTYPDYDGDLQFGGAPALIYADSNFLGTGDDLMVIFAGVFLMTNYKANSLFGDTGPTIKTNLTVLGIPAKLNEYSEGKKANMYNVKSPMINASIGIGKEYSIGLSMYFDNKVDFHYFFDEDKNVKKPEHKITYTGSIPLEFSTLDGNPSKLFFKDGYRIQLNPQLTYKPKYEAWGNTENTEYFFEHNNNPSYIFTGILSYHKVFLTRNNIGFDITYNYGYNLYKTNHFKAGSSNPVMPGSSLSGYYGGEFQYEHGALGSATYSFAIIENELIPFIRHDVFYNIKEKEYYQGSTLGFSASLPLDIEFSLQGSVGWNAERENGRKGYDLQASAMKVWFF